MDRARLAENGIFIEDGDGGCELLPPHVESLQDALLDFRRTIPDKFGYTEDELLQLLDKDGINVRDDMTDDDRAEIQDELEFCAGVRELTRHLDLVDNLEIGGYNEDDWKEQFEGLLLDPLVEEAQVCDTDTRQAARTKFYYDSFQQARDRPWTLFAQGDGSEEVRDDLPEPKPAWVAHFPVYVISPAEYDHQHSGLRHFASSHSIVDNFSQVTLEHLAGHGLQPSATGVTKTGRRGAALSPEYVCFPWLIVEHMKDEYKGKMELCYSRAANAGAAALKMLQNLSKHDSKFPDDTHIPPVVTLTTTHDVVRVWIMHSAHSKGTCEMQLIWSGSLTRMVDIFELRAILENCQTWATRVLRPWISRQIDLWKQQCPDDCPRPFDASLRHRVAKSRNSGLRPARDEDAPEREPKKNENKDADLRQIIREEHDRLLKQLSQASVETKRPTRSIATQTGPDAEGHPLEKSAVRPMTLDSARPFPRKILEPKPRLAKKIATSGPSLSSAKGETAPARARQETNDGTRLGDSVDLFKSTKKVYGKRRIFTIKLPDVSSEEILAQKPWLGVKKSSERDRQAKTVLTQKSQEKKAEVEEDPAEKDKVKKQDDDGTRNENNTTEENGAKGKSDYNKDDNGDDNRVDHEKGKEDEPKVPLIEAMEENYWRSILTTDDKEDPPNDATEAAPIPADEDAKEDSNPQPLTCSKDSSTRTTEMAKNERSSEIAKKENPKESIKIDRPEEIPENNHDEIIEKGNSEKLVQKGEKANSEGIVEGENPKDSISKDISKESAKHENPKETTENEDSGKGLVRENSDQDPQNMPTKSPLPTPEPEPADPLSPNPPAPAGQWAWLKDYGQNKDDNHKGLGQPTIKQDTTPPLKDGSSTFKAVKGILSPPAETNPSAVFDAAQWTDTKFAFGTSAHVMGARFTFQMKTEGGAEDPRNSSMPENQAKATRIFTWPRNQTNAERLFEWLEEHDDEPIPDENPLPLKLVKGGREFGASVERHTAKGDAEPQFLKTPESDTGSNSGPGNNDSQSGGGDGPALSSSKGNDKTRQDGGSRGASSRNQDGS